MISHLYRFRPVEVVLDKYEGLAKQEIYFASPEKLNDPMEHEHEAKAFLDDLKDRMRAFELALHPNKTRLTRFGRHAAKQREMREKGSQKPSTSSASRTSARDHANGVPSSSGARRSRSGWCDRLQAIKMELRRRMHDSIAGTGAWERKSVAPKPILHPHATERPNTLGQQGPPCTYWK